jgi:hypothetical protein
MKKLIRSAIWQRHDTRSMEHCQLLCSARGYHFESTVVAVIAGEPITLAYRIDCSKEFETREVHIELLRGSGRHGLELSRSGEGWRKGGQPLSGFDDLLDIDLSICPSTNTLPIRRLSMAVGESREVTALWVGFPDLVLETLPQRYTRTAESSYHYESDGGSFQAELEVDDEGLMVRYGSLWTRVAEHVTGDDDR